MLAIQAERNMRKDNMAAVSLELVRLDKDIRLLRRVQASKGLIKTGQHTARPYM